MTWRTSRPRYLLAAAAVAATLIAIRTRASACTVSGVPHWIDEVRVVTGSESPFGVWLRDQPVDVELSRAAQPVRIRTTGAMRFEGVVVPENMRYFVARPVELAGGLATIDEDARLTNVRTAAGQVFADATIDEGALRRIPLPCESLTVTEQRARPHPPERSGWVADTRKLFVFERRGGGRSWAIELARPLFLWEVNRQGAWAKVRTAHLSGWIGAWVLRSETRSDWEGPGSGHSEVVSGGSCALVGDDDSDVADGVIREETTVFRKPNVGPWAALVKQTRVRVRHDRGSEWAALANVPGVGLFDGGCEPVAWILRRDVAFNQ